MIAAALLALAQTPIDAAFASPAFEGASVSACVQTLDGEVLYERNSALRLIPASNEKLATCAFALKVLGPEFRPETKVWKTATRTVVESFGDPLMTRERLRQAAIRLKLDRRLPVYVKQSYAPYWPPTWEFDDLPNKYAAPVCAFTVDRGAIELWADQGRPVIEPEPYGIRLRWNPRSEEPRFRYDPHRREVTVSGPLPKERTRLDTLSHPRPDEAAATILGREFVQARSAPDSPPTAILAGNTLADTLGACLQPSDNNIAENLLLMATQRLEPLAQDPYSQARSQMLRFLTLTVGLPASDVVVVDGSGISRHNQLTTRGLARLLVWSARQPTAELWRRSLATPGIGTLRDRLSGVAFEGKTGTLDLVVGLSGYVKAKSGRDLAVSVLLNNYQGPSRAARDAADQFVRSVAEGL